MRYVWLILTALAPLTAGCTARHCGRSAMVPTLPPGGQIVPSVSAVCFPPAGWTAEPLKESPRHSHQIWLSPTGSTAYGVIHFTLPLPVGTELVLRAFLREMKRQEGAADLLHKQADPSLPGVRFEAEGNLYHLWANLTVRGWEGWAVYAGSKSGEPVIQPELDRAKAARDATLVGIR